MNNAAGLLHLDPSSTSCDMKDTAKEQPCQMRSACSLLLADLWLAITHISHSSNSSNSLSVPSTFKSIIKYIDPTEESMISTRINQRIFLALLPLFAVMSAEAFVPTVTPSFVRRVPKATTSTGTITSTSTSTSTVLKWSREEVEAARQTFERLHFDNSTGSLKPGPLPMTSNVQRLRSTELRLLEALADSDRAIDPIVELWINERQDAAEALHFMIKSRSRMPDLDREEVILRQLMDEYGPDGWVEPHGRLAVLLFTRGEYFETIDLCDYVLYVKPWHFEVAQLLAVTFLRVGDFRNALLVTRHCVLPPLHHPKRRRRWVERMTRLARERLEDAEHISATATLDGLVPDECPLGEDCWQ